MRLIIAIILVVLFACNSQQETKSEQSVSDSSKTAISANIEDTSDAIVAVNMKDDSIASDAAISTSIASFIPTDYSMLIASKGDLNRDQYMDMVLVLKKNGEDSTSDVVDHPEKRPLLLLLGQPDKTYKLARRNENSVLCVDCGGIFGDPFENVVIKNGFFTVEHYGGSAWRWRRDVTFKYVPTDSNWYLHKISTQSYHNANPEKTDNKIYTTKEFGKIAFENFDIYKDQ